MTNIPGPLAAFLIKKLGCRCTALIGSLLIVTGFFLSSLAPTLNFLIVTHAMVSGLGSCFIYVNSYAVIAGRFTRNQSLAVGIVASGISTGISICPVLVSLTYTRLGLSRSYQILAAICVIGCFLCLPYPSRDLMKPDQCKDNGMPESDLSVLRIPKFIAFTVPLMLFYVGYYIPYQHLVSFVTVPVIPSASMCDWTLSV